MKKIFLFFIISMPLCAMQLEDLKKTAQQPDIAKKSKQAVIQHFLNKKPSTRKIQFNYTKDGKELQGETSSIFCPGLNHTLIIPCRQTFAILLRASKWNCIIGDPSLIGAITHKLYTEPDEPQQLPYNAFICETTQNRGLSKLLFQDLDKQEQFIVTIVNN